MKHEGNRNKALKARCKIALGRFFGRLKAFMNWMSTVLVGVASIVLAIKTILDLFGTSGLLGS